MRTHDDHEPPLEYVLPLRWSDDAEADELTHYLAQLAEQVPVTVVDGSPPDLFTAHAARWRSMVRHVPPDSWPGGNGKVAGVMTGVRLARSEAVVIADDDVRWDAEQLSRAVALLADADVVRPQNVFSPLPWHARWDSARTLVNRGVHSDFPGTLVVRRSALLRAGGYRGDVIFENLELVRTLRVAGGREVRADDLAVVRRPPTAGRFWQQRVRQAYDSFAQPARLVAEASVVPLVVLSAFRRRPAVPVALALTVTALAARGRARPGADVIPVWTVALAPLWLAERAVCCWGAVAMRATGGVRYRGRRIRGAASSERALRRRATL
ncbi:glycosyltransferase [Cellulomonas edaphi]|uniref:4,4'-diaponeurosporenoate glycosyltransferase n=1 Tax=Cellulomonas edaphi TaxID=3053468 RepID=A0ABT7S7K1_9CELL|nr:glycosyltransferase family 2 protein [Cellulomons edaphi]MDM7831601.1 glycosyltransferase family 2 protein [Cellulomons edaphi]